MLVADTLFNIFRSYKKRVLRDWASAALNFLMPYCSGARVFDDSADFMDFLPRLFFYKLALISKSKIGMSLWGLK